VGASPIALGTDGGGSVRIPGSFSGVAGHKPTFGLVPKEPGFKGWKTLSVHGLLTRSVRDAALGLSVLAGSDPADDLSFPVPVGDLEAVASSPPTLEGMRVAYSPDLGISPVDSDVLEVFDAAVAALRSLGEVVKAAPRAYPPAALWNSIALVEGYASEGPLLGNFRAHMTPGTADIIEAGAAYSGADYVNALHEKAAYTRLWEEFFTSYDLLLAPAMPCTAYPVGQAVPEEIGGEPVDPFFDDWCALALPANLAGQPATAVPTGLSRDGLPVGLQVMGPRWSDLRTLAVAARLEALVDFVPLAGIVPEENAEE
jgi:Asp-tRNA(Asn)/Glu-tRNA(Gln) amidotransferase A subunit family amidase